MREPLLLHTCCAPCSTYASAFFEKEFAVVHIFYNPNIHPFQEYQKRWETLREYALKTRREVIAPFLYNPLEYFSVIAGEEERCRHCYRLRLERVAQWGKEHGFSFFSTTLTISPYQDVEGIKRAGEEVGRARGITFLGVDLRRGFSESIRQARELGLYRQKYCGCIFSQWKGVKKRLWKSLTGQSSS